MTESSPTTSVATTGKSVFYFSAGEAEGSASMKNTLGGKGANLAEMTSLGLPVPPGFTISTEMCEVFYKNGEQLPEELKKSVLIICWAY